MELMLIDSKTRQDWYWPVVSREDLAGVVERKPEAVEWCRKDEENREALLEAVRAVEGAGGGLAEALERMFREGEGVGAEAFAGAVRRVLAEGDGTAESIAEAWRKEREAKEAEREPKESEREPGENDAPGTDSNGLAGAVEGPSEVWPEPGGAAGPAHCVPNPSGGWTPDRGYVRISKRKNDYRVKWSPGKRYGDQFPNVIAAGTEGRWIPEPGHVWENTQDDSPRKAGKLVRVLWCPGRFHRDCPHVFACEGECEWSHEAGYAWVCDDPNDLSVRWNPGSAAGEAFPSVIAGAEEGTWIPEPGYVWKGSQNDWPRPKEKIKRVAWCPGRSHRDDGFGNIVSSHAEGKWIPADGYTWRKGAFSKILKEEAVAEDCDAYQTVYTHADFFRYLKQGDLGYRDLPDAVRKVVRAMRAPKTIEDILDGGLLPPSWMPGLPMPGNPHVIAGKNGQWAAESGHEWVNPDDANDFRVRKIPR